MPQRVASDTIRVLLAGEQALLRSGLKMLLSEHRDLEADEADGAASARRVWEDTKADVVVLDFDGENRQQAAALRELAAKDAKVVVMTANDDPELMLRAIQAGARGAAPASASGRSLVEAIRAVSVGLHWMTPDLERYCRQHPRTDSRKPPDKTELEPSAPWKRLTDRETQVAELVAQGLKHREIAERLGISVHTVKNHLRHVFVKLDVSNRVELAVYSRTMGDA